MSMIYISYHTYRVVHVHLILYMNEEKPLNKDATLLEATGDRSCSTSVTCSFLPKRTAKSHRHEQ